MDDRFLAYFDFIGYKEFILNNEPDYVGRYLERIFIDTEQAISGRQFTKTEGGRTIADLSKSKINCLNISDTIIFWTNDNTLESYKELLQAAHIFNRLHNLHGFPVRGCVAYGPIKVITDKTTNQIGGSYNINSLSGKGLLDAYFLAERLLLAGTVIDDSAINFINQKSDFEGVSGGLPLKCSVPVRLNKHVTTYGERYILRLVEPSIRGNEVAFERYKKNIEENFNKHLN